MGESFQEALEEIILSLLVKYLNDIEETVKEYVIVKRIGIGTEDETDYLAWGTACCNDQIWRFGVDGRLETNGMFIGLLMRVLEEELSNSVGDIDSIRKQCAETVYVKADFELTKTIRDAYQIDLEMIKRLSSMYYEGASCKGELFFDLERMFSPKQVSEKGPELLFEESSQVEFSNENSRMIRKLMESTGTKAAGGKNKALWMRFGNGGWRAVGLGRTEMNQANGIRVSFTGHMAWSMFINGEKIVEFKDYLIMNPLSYKNELMRKCREVFKIKDSKSEILWKLVDAARKQRHGTILIIMDKDKIDGELSGSMIGSAGIRLQNAFAFSEDSFEETIISISSIDGAVFMDTEGAIHGYGLILNGNYPVKGNSARGARYNSAVRYIASMANKEDGTQKVNSVAVIISEDGMLNVCGTEDHFETV